MLGKTKLLKISLLVFCLAGKSLNMQAMPGPSEIDGPPATGGSSPSTATTDSSSSSSGSSSSSSDTDTM